MFKYFTALFMILAISGQILAGVCACIESEGTPKHKCCKRAPGIDTSMTAKGCCDEDLCNSNVDRVPRRSSENAIYSFAGSIEEPNSVQAFPLRPLKKLLIPTWAALPIDGHRLKFARPPTLYLRHNSFLI